MPPEHRPAEAAPSEERNRRGAWIAAAWIAAGLAFAGAVWVRRGAEGAQQYLAGYLVELSLSVDNVFVFALVFRQFGVGPRRQRTLLLWGLAGAVILRTAFILAGVAAISRFHWIVPVLGALILATAARTAFMKHTQDPLGSGLVRAVVRIAPPALAAILVVEATDLVFALDSIPAVVAVTHDAAIAIASNLFAVLGLRSLYLAVSSAMGRFRFLNAGLSLVLAFVGAKMLAEPWFQVPTGISLVVIAAVPACAVGASALFRGGSRR